MFEFRIVQYFDTDGGQWTSWEVTTPEGTPEPHDHEVLGVIEKAKAEVIKWYASIDPEEPQ